MAVARQYRRLNSLPAPGNDLEKQAAIDSVNALIATLEKEKIQLDEKLKDNLLEMALAKKSNREQSEVRDDQRTALEMQAPFRYRRHQWLTFDWNFNGQEYYLFNADPKIPSGKQLEYISFAGRNHAIRYNRVQFGKDLSFYGSLAYAWGNANNAEELSILKIKSQQTFTSRITTSTKTGTSTIRDSTFVADTTNQPNRDVQALMKGDYETFSYQELNAQLIFFSENRAWGLDVQAAHRWLAGEGLSGKTTTSLGIGLIGSAINMTNKNAKFSAELLVTFRDLNNANPFNLKDVPREWYNRRTVTFRLSVPFPRQN